MENVDEERDDGDKGEHRSDRTVSRRPGLTAPFIELRIKKLLKLSVRLDQVGHLGHSLIDRATLEESRLLYDPEPSLKSSDLLARGKLLDDAKLQLSKLRAKSLTRYADSFVC